MVCKLECDSKFFLVYQANGLDERFNRTLQKMLVKYVASKNESWEDYLDTCVFAYNTSKHESSKFTPFEVMFSRCAVLPIDLTIVQTEAEKVEMKEFDDEELDIAMQKQRKRLERVKENILVAQQRQKAQYDLKHSNPVVFQKKTGSSLSIMCLFSSSLASQIVVCLPWHLLTMLQLEMN